MKRTRLAGCVLAAGFAAGCCCAPPDDEYEAHPPHEPETGAHVEPLPEGGAQTP